MLKDRTEDVTGLLNRWQQGDNPTAGDLAEAIYAELLGNARRILKSDRTDLPFVAQDLVSEVWLRIRERGETKWQNRTHFFAAAARIMRSVLVDRARNQSRLKRGGGMEVVEYRDEIDMGGRRVDVLRLNDALDGLARLDARQCEVVELRFFGGLSVEETANELGVAKATVDRDWFTARAWLTRELKFADPA